MVTEGVGYADALINTYESPRGSRPLSPTAEAELRLIRKRYQTLSKPAEKFLQKRNELK